MKIFGFFILGIVAFFLLIQAGNAMKLWNISFWGVKFEDARRDVFENTKSFRDGANRDLMNLCLDWQASEDPATRTLIASTISQRRLAVPDSALTQNTKQCLNGVK